MKYFWILAVRTREATVEERILLFEKILIFSQSRYTLKTVGILCILLQTNLRV